MTTLVPQVQSNQNPYHQTLKKSKSEDLPPQVKQVHEMAIKGIIDNIADVMRDAFKLKSGKHIAYKINEKDVPQVHVKGTKHHKKFWKLFHKTHKKNPFPAAMYYKPQQAYLLFPYDREKLYKDWIDEDLDQKISKLAPVQRQAIHFLVFNAAARLQTRTGETFMARFGIMTVERIKNPIDLYKSVFLKEFSLGAVLDMTRQVPGVFNEAKWWNS